MNTSPDLTALWTIEYERSGIPSSFRIEPSGAILELAAVISCHDSRGRAVDLGCGRGRNSLFLADLGYTVSSIDLVEENIEQLKRNANELGLGDRVDAQVYDLALAWPFEASTFDVAVDTFVYKHQTRPGSSSYYRSELARVIKKDGLLLLTLAGTDDGYYGPLLDTSPDPDHRVIVDPANEIPSILYDVDHIRNDFSEDFEILQWNHKVKDGEMHGGVYRRSTHVFILRRR